MIITFCGHSDFIKTTEYEQKMLALLEENVGDQKADFYLGGYGKFDSFAYDCCKKYQETHPRISLIFVTPYLNRKGQNDPLEHNGKRYDAILYPEIEDKPLKFAIYHRNRWMVEKADCVICGIERGYGGAYTTYRYAKSKTKPVFNIVDKTL